MRSNVNRRMPRQEITDSGASACARLIRNVATVLALVVTSVAPSAAAGQDRELSDSEISLAVESELIASEAVNSHNVNVSTLDGIAKLSGTVDHLLAKRKVVDIAEATKGVRSIVNTIVVKPPQRNDAQLQRDISDALLTDPAADSYEVDVSARDGVVTLTGTVDSYAEKQLAEEVAAGIRGVIDVKNNLDVEHETDRSDPQIRGDVEKRLASSVWVDEDRIDVSVDDGQVTLTGAVGSAYEKGRAKAHAWVVGTKSVNARNLSVNPDAADDARRQARYGTMTDEEVRKAVNDALLYDPRVYMFNPTVRVRNGIVTLTGTVDNLAAKQAAEQDARNTTGVWRVKNFLRVRPTERLTDAEVTGRIKNAFEQDPYLSRHDLSVWVSNGHAYLYGDVDSRFDASHAESVAARTKGVVDLANRLDIREGYTLKSDWEIREDIEDQLWWSPFVDSDEVRVTVTDGKATLAGTVDSLSERRAAAENAIEGGAHSVVNRLHVRHGPEELNP